MSKQILILFALLFSAGKCLDDDPFTKGGPATGRLLGSWRLDSMLTPAGMLTNDQKDFREKLKIEWDNGYHVEQTIRDDSVINVQYWFWDPAPVVQIKERSFIITYRYGLKRYYKMHLITGQPSLLEATDYVDKIGGAADTTRFYYTESW